MNEKIRLVGGGVECGILEGTQVLESDRAVLIISSVIFGKFL